jgi:hypothetical protein
MEQAIKILNSILEVGAVSLTSPTENSTSIIASGGSLTVAATNNGPANYKLKANGKC